VSDKFYGDRYYREVAGVQHCIGIGTRPYLDALEAQVGSASVRFDAVEDLVARLENPHPLIKAEDIAARPTLVAQISTSEPSPGDPLYRWGGTATKLWLIHAADEIQHASSQMASYALEKCEPIFDSLSNPAHALSILSGDDQRSRSYSGPDQARAMRAIALAFLMHGEATAKQLAKVKLARLKGEGLSEVVNWTDKLFQSEEKGGARNS
jgi:hypothetical protein